MAEFIKNLKKKVEHYKTKAEEIRAMVEEGAETIRDIRADVEDTVEDLKADSEEKMMESLEKIQEAEQVFKEAGYKLHAVEMEMGFNPKVVSEGLGHSTVGITLDLYSHVLPNMQQHAAEAVAKLLKRK